MALARCRTAALGGHLAVCGACGHTTPVYHSCRNRHCPTCQGLDQHRWLEARRERILPTRYFHIVFTLPEALRAIVRYNREALFAMLFRAASQALLALARDPRRLGALPAITMVLHNVDAGAALPSPPPRRRERGRALPRRHALGADEGRRPLPGEGAGESLPRVCRARRSSRASPRAPSRCRRAARPTCSISSARRCTVRRDLRHERRRALHAAGRRVSPCARRVRRRYPSAPRRISGHPSGALTRSRRQVAVAGGAADCTAAGAAVDRWPTLFPHRRLPAARRLRGFVQPRLGEAPDASWSAVTRPRWRSAKTLSLSLRTWTG